VELEHPSLACSLLEELLEEEWTQEPEAPLPQEDSSAQVPVVRLVRGLGGPLAQVPGVKLVQELEAPLVQVPAVKLVQELDHQ